MSSPEPQAAAQAGPISNGLGRGAYIIGFLALGAVTLLGFAAPFLPVEAGGWLRETLAAIQHEPWAVPTAISAYVLFASLGVPQIVLITALVVVFGPWAGLAYSWTGKMFACALGFWVGRRFGARIVARHAGPKLSDFMRMLERRGFWASALIRLVPTVPSVLINIAAGATPIRFRDFIAGTAIGSVPKMAMFAFGGHAAMVAVHENALWAWGLLAGVIALWITLAVLGRRWMRRRDGAA